MTPNYPHVNVRRHRLKQWLNAESETTGSMAATGLTATEIVNESGLYEGHYRYDRCFDDLKVLEDTGFVIRGDGRPALWRLTA